MHSSRTMQRSGKNTNRMECKSASGNRTKTIFALLPVEIWWLVLDQVQNPSDLWSCFHANTEWKYILESLKPTWTSMQLFKILPLIYKLLSANDLLKLRLVSRRWKISVDVFQQYEQINQPISTLRYFEYVRDLKVCSVLHSQKVKLSFKNQAKNIPSKTVLDFQSEMDQFVRHPAVVHTTCVTDFCWQDHKPVFYDLTPFFEQYGVYITNLCLHFRYTPADQVIVYLQNFLKNTPNLKSLSIAEHLYIPTNFQCSSKNLNLPLLPKLQHLEINAEHTALRDFMLEDLLFLNVQHFANISMLNVGISCVKDLIILKRVSCEISELHLNIAETCNVCFENVLKTIEHFNKSLKVLKISRAPPVHGLKQTLTAIQLPHLQILSLVNMHQILPLLFLFGKLEELQQLTVHCSFEPCNQGKTEEYIPHRVWDCEKTEAELLMSTSKLWKRYPNLMRIKVYPFESDTPLFYRSRCEKLQKNLCTLKHILHTPQNVIIDSLRALPYSCLDLLSDPHPYRRLPFAPLVILTLLVGAWKFFGVTGFLVVALLWVFVYSEAITHEDNLLMKNLRFHSFSSYDDLN